jgi:hypothetical protein
MNGHVIWNKLLETSKGKSNVTNSEVLPIIIAIDEARESNCFLFQRKGKKF